MMIKYLKKEIKHLPFITIAFILFYVMSTFATDYLFHANDINYNNSTSHIASSNVQGAIDELYSCAVNYRDYKQKFINVENTVGNSPLTTISQNIIGAVNEINNRFDSNVLKIANGGTGATTAAGARTNFDVPSTADIPTVVPIQDITGSGITANITKYGHVVTIKIASGKFTAALAAGATIMTVPEGYRPYYNQYPVVFTDQSATATANLVLLHIDSATGAITTPIALSKDKLIRGTLSYISS